MLSEFITDLRNSKFYKELFVDYDVMLIYVSGSQLYGARDERSDYDLIVLVNGECKTEPNEYLTYKGEKVHWYWENIDNFIVQGNEWAMFQYGNVLFKLIDDEHIIYKNKKYADEINNLIEQKREIAKNGAMCLYDSRKKLIESILEKSRIDERDYTKFLGHLCVTSYLMLDEPIDDSLVLPAKRIRWQPVDESIKTRIIERLRLLKQWRESISE